LAFSRWCSLKLFIISLRLPPDPAKQRGIGTISLTACENLAATTAWSASSTGVTLIWRFSIVATFDRIQSRSPLPDEVRPIIAWLVWLATSAKHNCTASVPKFMSPATITTPLAFVWPNLLARRSCAWVSVFFKACDLNFSLNWEVLPGMLLDLEGPS
jgi:hypothetical protein